MSDENDLPDPRPEPRRFPRPWEVAGDEAASAATEGEAPEGSDPTTSPESGEEDAFAKFSAESYRASTTQEYRGLAEEVSRANAEQYERQAVAATIPGVGSGLIGFEDVTGKKGLSEEEVEAEEQARASDLTVRVTSAVVLVGLFVASLVLGGVWFTAFVAVVMVLALGELYATLRTRGYAPLALFGLLGILAVAVGAHSSGPPAIGGWVAATALAVALFYSVTVRRNPLDNAAVTIFGMVWVAMAGFVIVIARAERGVVLVLLVVLLTAIFDIGSYFVGRSLGRRPLAPRVSPRKTVEGLLGGVGTTFVVAALLSAFPAFDPLSLQHSLMLAGVVSVMAPLGDAAESVVKRALGVKDMGSLIPGHGGMLDRIDAMLFVVPAAYVLFDVLGYLQ